MLRFRGIKICLIGLMSGMFLGGGMAHAQDLPCNEPFGTNDFVTKMDAAEAALAEFNLEGFRALLTDVQDQLPCTYDRIHPNYLTRYARQMAMSFFLDQDEMTMAQWGTLAGSNAEMPWPAALEDETHPFRDALAFIEEPWINGPEGAGLNPPKGGAIFLDGVLLKTPVASAETPHFIQVLDKRGLVVESFWQEGSGFAHRLLKADVTPPEIPSWYKAPDLSLDPMKLLKLTDEEKANIESLRKEAQAEKQAEEDRLAKQYAEQEASARRLEEAERKREEKRQAQDDKRRSKQRLAQVDLEADVGSLVPLEVRAPETWVDFVFESEKADMVEQDLLERTTTISACADLLKLEPRALLGRLKETEIQCLEHRLRHTARMTMRDKVSRVLMADAWAKKLPHRWEAAMRRHLTEIDRSDADLCFIYARHLTKGGVERVRDTIRWSETALQNARRQWSGEILTKRMYALHRMRSLAAQQKWHDVEQQFLINTADRFLLDRASRWRNITKSLAREWLEHSVSANLQQTAPFQVCVSAAGTEDYCKTGN
jgi:hypothetical protein